MSSLEESQMERKSIERHKKIVKKSGAWRRQSRGQTVFDFRKLVSILDKWNLVLIKENLWINAIKIVSKISQWKLMSKSSFVKI